VTVVWDYQDLHPAVANLLSWQRQALLKKLEQEIAQDHADGFSLSADAALDRYISIKQQMERGIL
jgi:hypothetical protein